MGHGRASGERDAVLKLAAAIEDALSREGPTRLFRLATQPRLVDPTLKMNPWRSAIKTLPDCVVTLEGFSALRLDHGECFRPSADNLKYLPDLAPCVVQPWRL